MNDLQKRKGLIAFTAVVVTLICLIPCYRGELFAGDDMNYHIIRIESIYNAIKSGQGIKSYVYELLMSGYGYGAGIFYPDIFLYPAVLFRLIGASPEVSMKLLICLCFFATCFTSYMAGKHIGRDSYVGLIVMIIYTMGHYHLLDVYIRSAIGELIAMIFIPLVFWGLYDLTENGYRKKGVLCVAFAGLLLSHTISLVLCGIMAVIWVLIRIKKVWNRKCITGVLTETVICLLLTAFYWLPVLEQFANDSFYVNENPAFYPSEDVMTIPRIYGGIFSVSFIELGIMVLLILLGIKNHKLSKKSIVSSAAAVILLVIETDIFPWELIDKTIFVSIQFPWRLNMFTEFFAAMAIGCQIKALFGDKLCINKNLYLAETLCILLGAFHVISIWQSYMKAEYISYKNYPDDYIETAENTNDVGFYEWLPASFDLNETIYSENINMVLTDNGYYDGTYNDDGSFTYEPDGYYGYAVFPKTYYKGYAATAVFADGTGAEITVYESDNGLVGVYIPEGAESVTVWYEGTIIQKVSAGISLSLIIIVIICAFIKIGEKSKDEKVCCKRICGQKNT